MRPIVATPGNDIISGEVDGPIDGGDGIDIVTYGWIDTYALAPATGVLYLSHNPAGPTDEYHVQASGAAWEVLVRSNRFSGDRTDILTNIEALKFTYLGSDLTFGLVDHVQYSTPGSEFYAFVRAYAFDARTIVIDSGLVNGLTAEQNIHVTGSFLNDQITGHSGRNVINGLLGVDTMQGGAGNDVYFVDDRNDKVIEAIGGGFDVIKTSTSYTLGAGVSVERLEAVTRFNSLGDFISINLTGNSFGNRLVGDGSDNFLNGAGGADTMEGGGGDDTYRVDNLKDRIVELKSQGYDKVYAYTDYRLTSLAEIEELALANPASTASFDLSGSNYANKITGNAGSNILKGLNGNDTLDGGLGNDKLYGGIGRDHFVFSTKLNGRKNVDTIYDFSPQNDKILLNATIFDNLPRSSLKGAFTLGSAARDASDRIIYDPATGALYYDDDSTGSDQQIQFAILQKNLKLTTYNFSFF